MTANQINFQKMLTERDAQIEQARHNIESEQIGYLQAQAALSQAASAAEHNRLFGIQLSESARHNEAVEAETHRSNTLNYQSAQTANALKSPVTNTPAGVFALSQGTGTYLTETAIPAYNQIWYGFEDTVYGAMRGHHWGKY